ncbi:MAG: rhomboid family intramembrane serine protease [Bacteroidetes Order II. Incertae sedis bacterium]|nr:rhomboid family intramembrane serine protease [Bacteroidetes Order II. bacterium]
MNSYSYRPPSQFSLFPPVVKNLLILNGLFYFAQITFSGMGGMFSFLEKYLALWPLDAHLAGDVSFYPWQVVSYSFLHGGLFHLILNMYALWMFGAQIETVWGPRRFTLYYFICVVGAAVAQLSVSWYEIHWLDLRYIAPTVGASGGVFGILLAFGMMYPEYEIYFFPFPVPIKAKWFVLIYGVIELMNGVTGGASNIAHFAHLGGMVAGLILMLKWGYRLPFGKKRT